MFLLVIVYHVNFSSINRMNKKTPHIYICDSSLGMGRGEIILDKIHFPISSVDIILSVKHHLLRNPHVLNETHKAMDEMLLPG